MGLGTSERDTAEVLSPFWGRCLAVMLALLCFYNLWTVLLQGRPSAERLNQVAAGVEDLPALGQQMQAVRDSFFQQVEEQKDQNAEKLQAGEKAYYIEAYKTALSKISPPHRSGDYSIYYTDAQKLSLLRAVLIWPDFDDETATLSAISRIKPGQGDFDPKFYNYGGSYLYGVGALIFAAKSLGMVDLSGGLGGMISHPDDLGTLYTLARLPGALLTAFAVLAVYGIAARLFNRSVGVLAAGFIAFLPLWWSMSVVAKPHGYAMGWAMIAIYFAVRARDMTPRAFYWSLAAGIAAGLAGGASLGYLSVGLAVALMILRFDWNLMRSFKLTLLAALACAVVFAVTNPFVILKLDHFLFTFQVEGASFGRASVAYEYLLDRAVYDIIAAKGYLLLFVVPGLFLALFNGTAWRVSFGTILQFVLATLLTFLLWTLVIKALRLCSYVMPLMAILAAVGIERVFVVWGQSTAAKRSLTMAALLVVVSLPAMTSLAAHASLAGLYDTVRSYRQWSEENRAAMTGKTVGLVAYPSVSFAPPLFSMKVQDLRQDILDHHGLAALEKPDYIYDSAGDFQRLYPTWFGGYDVVFDPAPPPIQPWLKPFLAEGMVDALFTKAPVIYKRREQQIPDVEG